MPIFQERKWQEEPDICALDVNGSLVIFELKRGSVQDDTTIQIMRYAQKYGQMKYKELELAFKNYTSSPKSLKEAHAETFDIEENPLSENLFNRHQIMIIIGNSLDLSLINAVEYWKDKKLDIDFKPYRFYRIGDDIFFDIFVKPYDYHISQ